MTNKPVPHSMLRNPRHLFSLGFGSGLSPYAPGTMGTLAAIPFYLLLSLLELPAYLIVIAVGFVLGVYLCHYTSKALKVHDHPGIVWDEFIGYWITMIAAPAMTWQCVLAGFLLFRIFDIVKPWPVNIADKKVPGGLGIMIDDVLAGLYAFASLQFFWILVVEKL